jgi:hypothetical protein
LLLLSAVSPAAVDVVAVAHELYDGKDNASVPRKRPLQGMIRGTVRREVTHTAGSSALQQRSRWTDAPHRAVCRGPCLRKIQESSLGVPTKSCLIEANAPVASTLIRPMVLCGVRGLCCMLGRGGEGRRSDLHCCRREIMAGMCCLQALLLCAG